MLLVNGGWSKTMLPIYPPNAILFIACEPQSSSSQHTYCCCAQSMNVVRSFGWPAGYDCECQGWSAIPRQYSSSPLSLCLSASWWWSIYDWCQSLTKHHSNYATLFDPCPSRIGSFSRWKVSGNSMVNNCVRKLLSANNQWAMMTNQIPHNSVVVLASVE